MKLNSLLASSMVILSIGAFEIFILDLGSSEVKKYSAQSSNVAKIKSSHPGVRRTSGPENRQTFIRPTRPFLFPAVLSPAAFLLPAAVGIGAGLFWLFSQRITAEISDIGSPGTNITIDLQNTNNPTMSQSLRNTNLATNTNNDADTITQTVTNSNVNNGR